MNAHFWRLFWRQVNIQMRIRVINAWNMSVFFIQPAIFSAVGMILARVAGQQVPNLVYTVIGGGVMGIWSGMLFTSTFDILRDRRDGVLELIVGSPTSLGTVEAIRTFANVSAGLVSMLAALLAAVCIFHYDFHGANLGGAVFSFALLLVGMWAMGLFLSNFLAWSRLSGTFINYLEAPVAVLCGFMYPVSILPGWMQAISMIFPIRWALEAMDACLLGTSDPARLVPLWGLALAVILVYLLLAHWLEGLVHDKIRVTGELNSI
jgi:ABC-2 type transport system permease protein